MDIVSRSKIGILRARGGSSHQYQDKNGEIAYSPRTRR